MPQLSSSGSVLRWLSAEIVLEQADHRAFDHAEGYPEVEAVGVFRASGCGDTGVGGELDLVLVLRESGLLIWKRLRSSNIWNLPLSTDLLVYCRKECDTSPRLEHHFRGHAAA